MLAVRIEINGYLIEELIAVRIAGEEHQPCTYEITRRKHNRGTIISEDLGKLWHTYDDGAITLVEKMLKKAKYKDMRST